MEALPGSRRPIRLNWSLARLDIPADVRTRVTHKYSDAGHMMYTRDEDLAKLKKDLAVWLSTMH